MLWVWLMCRFSWVYGYVVVWEFVWLGCVIVNILWLCVYAYIIHTHLGCMYVDQGAGWVWVCKGKFGWLNVCACHESGESLMAMSLIKGTMSCSFALLDRGWMLWKWVSMVVLRLRCRKLLDTQSSPPTEAKLSVKEPLLCLETWWVVWRTEQHYFPPPLVLP